MTEAPTGLAKDAPTLEPSSIAIAQSVKQHPSPNRDILTAAKGGGILFFGSLFDYGSRFLFGIIVGRALGTVGYGLYGLGGTIATALAGIAVLGLPAGIVRFLPIALGERDEDRAWGILQVAIALVGAFGLSLGLMLFVLAGWVAENLFHEPDVAPVLRIISARIPLVAMGEVLMAALQGFKRMEYQVYANNIVFNVGRIALTVLALSLGWGVLGAVAAFVVASAIKDGLLIYFLNRLFPLRRSLRAARRNVRELVSFSLPMCLSRLIGQIGSELQIMFLGMFGTIAAVGVFNAVVRIQVVGAMLLTAAEMVAMPIISSLYHQNENVQLRQLYQTLTRWSLSFVLPFFLTTFLFARPTLNIFGKEFEVGASALVIVCLGTLINAGTGICGAMLVMTGHSRLTFLNSVISTILTVVFGLLFIPIWGAAGAAIAFAVSVSVVNIARLFQVYWLHKLWPYNRAFVKPLLAGAIALAVGLATRDFMPAEQSLFYLILNVAALWLSFAAVIALLGLSEEDRVVLSRTMRRFSMALARH